MQIQINMNTINKYIHAQEATITKANPYIETDGLSAKAKSLLVKLVERGFYFKIPTTTLNTLKEELESELTSNNDVAVTTEDTPVNGDVSTNDSATSTGTLTFAKTTDPIHGTVLFNSNGTYTYTPNTNFNGTDSFTYTVTDTALGESKVNTVTITVNPVLDLVVNDITATIAQDTVLEGTLVGVVTTTSGGVLEYSKATDPVNGTVVVNVDGTFTYTPTASYIGEDTFDFTVIDEDSGETRTETATITIEVV